MNLLNYMTGLFRILSGPEGHFCPRVVTHDRHIARNIIFSMKVARVEKQHALKTMVSVVT